MNRSFVVALLLGALALAPALAGAQEDKGNLEQFMVETAHTKAEHQALADHYKQEAAEARAKASFHKSMEQAYLGSKSGNKTAATNHCKKIWKQQEAIAQEFDALAKLHEDEAKKAQ